MTNINDSDIYDVAQWIVYSIEDLGLQFMESESSLPFELYIRNRAVVHFQAKYRPDEVHEIFEDHRVQTIINFFEEGRDELSDSLH